MHPVVLSADEHFPPWPPQLPVFTTVADTKPSESAIARHVMALLTLLVVVRRYAHRAGKETAQGCDIGDIRGDASCLAPWSRLLPPLQFNPP